MSDLHVVTGAFGFSGRHIAARLLEQGRRVRTLTAHPQPDQPLAQRIEVAPLSFDDHSALVQALRGADTLFNTYWIRFPRGPLTFTRARPGRPRPCVSRQGELLVATPRRTS